MEDYRQDVLEAAEGIMGELNAPQFQLLKAIVEAVCQRMNRRLKEGVSNLECRNAYIPACAMYAVSYLRGTEREELSSFTAGTLSLSFGDSKSNLTRIAEELMAPWLSEPIIFRGVKA